MADFDLNFNSFKLGKKGENFDFSKVKAGVIENEKNKLIFEKFDKNNNGVLEKEEVKELQGKILPFSKDGVVSKREANKILKDIGLSEAKSEVFFEFLQSIGTSSEEVEDCFYSLFENGKESVNIKYKKDEEGFVRTSSRDAKTGALIQDSYDNGVLSKTVYYSEDGSISGEEIKQGAKTTFKDSLGRVVKEVINKGSGISEVTEYEYEGTSAEVKNITNKKFVDGVEIKEPEAPVQDKNKKVFANGRIMVKTENGTTLQDPNGEPVEIKYDKDGNILSNAKSGETFDQTAERLGIKKGTQEFEKFKELNAKAAKNGWFNVGAEVKIPAGLEDKINLEGLNVDSSAEVSKFEKNAIKDADVSKYTEENTEKKVLDKNTTWWQLAKDTLKTEGKENPTNAEISERTKELQKLNNGKEPVKGSEVILPKRQQVVTEPEVSPEVEETYPTTDTVATLETEETVETPVSPQTEGKSNIREKYSAVNLEKTYPGNKFNIITETSNYIRVVNKATGYDVLCIVMDNSAHVTKYDENGKEYEFILENSKGVIEYRSRKNPETGEYITSETFNSEGQIIESRSFYQTDNGSLSAEVTDYVNGKPYRIYDTSGNKPIRYPLAEALKDDIYAQTALGLPTTGKDICKHILEINASNVKEIMNAYKEINDDNESLVSAIIAEYGLSKDERIQYLGHIKQTIIERAKATGKYTDDISEDFDEEVRYQMRKIGFADGEYLDSYIKKLNSRFYISDEDNKTHANGKIDEDFKQGQTGDCWLLAAIKAITNTPKGLEILNDSLKVDKNGNVTVTLKGVGRTYLIKKEELVGNNQFVAGDVDVRAIEIAMDRYFQEERGVNGRLDLVGNRPFIAFNILTGQGDKNILSDTYGRIPDYWFSDSQIDNFNKPNHVAVVFTSSKDNMSYSVTNEETQTLLANHAYTVKGSDEDNVYLINPHDTSKVITVPRDIFKDFFNFIDEFDLG